MTPEDKEYVDAKFQEIKDFLKEHEAKDHAAFKKIYEAIDGGVDQLEVCGDRLESVLALVKTLHDGRPK